MDKSKAYSLAIYEKALPSGLSLEEKLTAAAHCGFDRLEISIDESDERLERLDWSEQQREFAETIRNLGVPIRTMCLSAHRKYPFGASDGAVRRKSLDIMKKAVDFGANIGVSIIQLAGYDVYYEESTEQTRRDFRENLMRAVEYAAGNGMILAFETMETPFMDTVEKAMYYVDKVKSPWLGVYPDAGNLQNAAVCYGRDVMKDFDLGAGHIFALHLKETKPGVYRNMRFGSGGHTEYRRFVRHALDMGVRMFTAEFWYQEGQDGIAEAKRASRFLREILDEASQKNPVVGG